MAQPAYGGAVTFVARPDRHLRRVAVAIAAAATLAAPAATQAASAGLPELSYGGGDGEVDTTVAGARLVPTAILVPPAGDGSSYVLARAYTDLTTHTAVVVKLTATGIPDPAFGGGDGIAEVPGLRALDVPDSVEPYSAMRGRPLALTTDGLLVGGSDSSDHAVVTKLQLSGAVATGFGTGGTATVSSDTSAVAAVAVRANGNVVAAGTVAGSPGWGIFLSERSATGAATTALDGDGFVTRDPISGANALDRIVDLHVRSSGPVVVARDAITAGGDPNAGTLSAVDQYTTAGVLDTSFNGDGVIDVGTTVFPSRLVTQPGGGFVIAQGRTDTPSPTPGVTSRVVDADGLGDATVRTAVWGTQLIRPATGVPLSDGSVALFGRRVDDGPRTATVRLTPAGLADTRWAPGAVTPGLGGVSSAAGDGLVTDAGPTPDGRAVLAVVQRSGVGTVPLTVAKVGLNGAPVASLTATPNTPLGPQATVTFSATGTVDPDGPTDSRTYRFDVDGDGTVDETTSSPTIQRVLTGSISKTASVKVTDSLGAEGAAATATYTVGDGTVPTTPEPTTPEPTTPTTPPTSTPERPFEVTPFPSVFTPPAAQTGSLTAPLIGSFVTNAVARAVGTPVQVGDVTITPSTPDEGDRVRIEFTVDLRGGNTATVCRVIASSCATLAGATITRAAGKATVTTSIQTTGPITLARFRVNNGTFEVEVPVTVQARALGTVPDYDIVGVELTQGVQRDTASARPGAPERRAAYDGVTLAGTAHEWGHDPVLSGEVPRARIIVWVVAHGIRGKTAPAPELYVSLGRSHAMSNGYAVRYGRPNLLRAPNTVPVTAAVGVSPELRADIAKAYVYEWKPDIKVPEITARVVGATQCDGCAGANDEIKILRPRVAVSRMRPTNVVSVYKNGSSAFVPDDAPLTRAPTPGRLRCLVGPGGNASAEDCQKLKQRLQDEAPAGGEPYRPNDRFFTESGGPLASLTPFILGATPAGQAIVPAGSDAFTTAMYAHAAVLGSGLSQTKATVALTAECVQTAQRCEPGTSVLAPNLVGLGLGPVAVARNGGAFTKNGLARSLNLAWGLAPASGRGGAVGAARWAPDETGYLNGHAAEIVDGPTGARRPGNAWAPTTARTADCGNEDLRDLSGACGALPTPNGDNGTWISPRRWDALLVGATEQRELVNGNTVSSGATIACPYRAINTTFYAAGLGALCPPPAGLFDPRTPTNRPFDKDATAARAATRAATAGVDATGTRTADLTALSVTLRTSGTKVVGFGSTPIPATSAQVIAAVTTEGPVTFRTVNADGGEMAKAGATPTALDLGAAYDGPTDPDVVASTLLPMGSEVAGIEAIVDGKVVARLARGGAPTGAFVSPAPGTTLPRSGQVTIDARLSDPDRDGVLSRIEASADGGATWATVATSGVANDLRIDAATLPPSAAGAGRLRVLAADGFQTTTLTSGPLTFPGPALALRITGAPESTKQAWRLERGDATVLTAEITGRTADTVRWRTSKGRVVGKGLTFQPGRLRSGSHTLTATVQDGKTRIRSAPLRVRVVPSAPVPVVLAVRKRRGCGAVSVRVATDVAATVKAGRRTLGKTRASGRAPATRTVRVPAPCGTRSVKITLVGPLGQQTHKLALRR